MKTKTIDIIISSDSIRDIEGNYACEFMSKPDKFMGENGVKAKLIYELPKPKPDKIVSIMESRYEELLEKESKYDGRPIHESIN